EFDWFWMSARELISRIDDLLLYYLRQPRLSCCTMQAGFFIEIDGVPWNGPDSVDEFVMAATWLSALGSILARGKKQAFGWAWEESSAQIRRHGNLLDLEDIHHSGQVVCPKRTVELEGFARQMLRESQAWVELADHTTRELDNPKYQQYSDEAKGVLLANL